MPDPDLRPACPSHPHCRLAESPFLSYANDTHGDQNTRASRLSKGTRWISRAALSAVLCSKPSDATRRNIVFVAGAGRSGEVLGVIGQSNRRRQEHAAEGP